MEILEEIKSGNKRSLRKFLSKQPSLSDDHVNQEFSSYLKLQSTPKIIGLVGNPGAGKSTFLNLLLSYKKRKKVAGELGLLLIDPANPETGGALLGDRIRMIENSTTEDIFIRSVSNLGESSDINRYLDRYLLCLSHYPFSTIIIEAVGSGQSVTKLRDYVDHLVFIFDPHSGDGIQHLKNGLLDIVDDLIISKADLFPTDNIVDSLQEWSANHFKIWKANLLEESNLDKFFNTRVFSSGTSNKIQLSKVFLLSELEQKMSDLIEDFSRCYFTDKTPLTDYKSLELKEKFRTFFLQNY